MFPGRYRNTCFERALRRVFCITIPTRQARPKVLCTVAVILSPLDLATHTSSVAGLLAKAQRTWAECGLLDGKSQETTASPARRAFISYSGFTLPGVHPPYPIHAGTKATRDTLCERETPLTLSVCSIALRSKSTRGCFENQKLAARQRVLLYGNADNT